jgi:hypothetical protein
VQNKYSSSPCACLARDLAHVLHTTLRERRVLSSFDLSVDALVVTAALFSKNVAICMNCHSNPVNVAFWWGSTFCSLEGVVKTALSGVLHGAGLVLRGPCASLARNLFR